MRYRQAQPGVQVTDLLANLKAVTCREHFLASFAEYGSGSQVWQPQDTGVYDWWAGWPSCPQLQGEPSPDIRTACMIRPLHPLVCCATALGSDSTVPFQSSEANLSGHLTANQSGV
jgi:hypothetical protein